MEPVLFTCPCCGKEIFDIPELGYEAPLYHAALPEAERAQRAFLTSDLCILDGEEYFVRAVCRIPVQHSDRDYGWGIWVSLSEENFRRYADSFNDSDQSKLGGMFGWFSNNLPGYPKTLELQTTVVPQDNRQRPLVFVNGVHADHPLYIEQNEGITQKRLAEIYARNLCSSRSPDG